MKSNIRNLSSSFAKILLIKSNIAKSISIVLLCVLMCFCATGCKDEDKPVEYSDEIGIVSGNVQFNDDESPSITLSNIKSYTGAEVDYLSKIIVSDPDKYDEMEIWVDASLVDIFTPGDYKAVYTFIFEGKEYVKDIVVTIIERLEAAGDEYSTDNTDNTDNGDFPGIDIPTIDIPTIVIPSEETTKNNSTTKYDETTKNNQTSKQEFTTKDDTTVGKNETTKEQETTKNNQTTKPVDTNPVTTKPITSATTTKNNSTTTKKNPTTSDRETTKNNQTTSKDNQSTTNSSKETTSRKQLITGSGKVTTKYKELGYYSIELLSGKLIKIKCTTTKYIVSTHTTVTYTEKKGNKYKVSKLVVTYSTGDTQVLETVEEKVK